MSAAAAADDGNGAAAPRGLAVYCSTNLRGAPSIKGHHPPHSTRRHAAPMVRVRKDDDETGSSEDDVLITGAMKELTMLQFLKVGPDNGH